MPRANARRLRGADAADRVQSALPTDFTSALSTHHPFALSHPSLRSSDCTDHRAHLLSLSISYPFPDRVPWDQHGPLIAPSHIWTTLAKSVEYVRGVCPATTACACPSADQTPQYKGPTRIFLFAAYYGHHITTLSHTSASPSHRCQRAPLSPLAAFLRPPLPTPGPLDAPASSARNDVCRAFPVHPPRQRHPAEPRRRRPTDLPVQVSRRLR